MGTISQEIQKIVDSQMKKPWIVAFVTGFLSLMAGCTPESLTTQSDSPQSLTKSFTQWCKEKDNLPAATKLTVDLLLKEAETADCELANTKLLKVTQLDFYHNNISNVEPLASLKNLTTLDLVGNQITDVKPLARLSNLTYLALSKNRISDIKPLAGLVNLTYLSLNQNLITDVKSLASLINLTDLNLLDNQLVDKKMCPVSEYACSF